MKSIPDPTAWKPHAEPSHIGARCLSILAVMICVLGNVAGAGLELSGGCFWQNAASLNMRHAGFE